MEKNNVAIIEEIRATIARLREEIGTLEERLSELDFNEREQTKEIVTEEAVAEETVVEEIAVEELPLDITLDDDMPQMEELQEPVFQTELAPEQEILEAKPVEAVFEQAAEDAPKVFFESVMPDTLPWKRDVPGSAVQNILSAISLNDRVQFINALFGGDPMLFQNSIRNLNSFSSLAEAENFIAANFPKWKLDSDVVYRFMMAVRRKLN
ncbi:MAG: hypothetical protein MJY80_02060 [Bacteroidales bacterium]|nr:hypothetical protein [Bacteroidales bacterium]